MNGKTFRNRLLATSVIAGALAIATPATAQDADTEDEARQSTIMVTGSRIAKQDFVANSPITTIDAELFELTGTINTEDLLNTLPQLVPGFGKSSNNPGDGTATADLRGLGTVRTLVLIDGKRMIPTRQTGVVDLNNIPAAMVERVEVITGGASAVYGSDAVSGVVNFIMKDDFEGVELRTGYEATLKEGDAEIYSLDLTFGANFADGRGNITTNLGYVNRKAVFQGDRSTTTLSNDDNGANVPGFGESGSSGVPGGHSFLDLTNFDAYDFSLIGYTPGATECADPNGNAVVGFSADCVGQIVFTGAGEPSPWINAGPGNTRFNYAPFNYLQLPQERYIATSIFNYDITPDATIYGRFSGAFNQVPQELAPTPAFTSITTRLDSPFLSPNAVTLLSQNGFDSTNDGNIDSANLFIGRRMVEAGSRKSNDDFFSFQFQTGLKGELVEGLGYDVFFQSGRTQRNGDLEGDISASRFVQASNVTDDGNGNAVCVDPSNGCAPINIYGPGNIDAAALAFVKADLNGKTEYNQTVFGATLNGDSSVLFELPGGPIGWAAGLEYREESSDFRPSDALARGDLLGFLSAAPLSGGFDVYDVYGEFYAPILADMPFVEILAIEGAYRYSDYSTVGGVGAWKIGGEWAPNEQIRFHALYNTAVRAPNINELFSPQNNGFPNANDPCSASQAPTGAVATLCTATGVPNVGTYEQRNQQIEGLFGGNPNLGEESADTITAGVAITPTFIDGLQITIDYYDIEITDYITNFGGGVANVLANCYSTVTNPTFSASNPFCAAINRSPGGEPIVSVTQQNVASQTIAGIDFQVNYGFELDSVPGDFQIAYIASYLDDWTFTADATSAPQDCAGLFGQQFCGDPIPEYKHTVVANWALDKLTTNLRWRYIGSTDDDNDGPDFDVETLDAVSYIDLDFAYDLNDTVRLQIGIDNLLDKDFQQLGNNSQQANTYPSTYDVFGRQIFVGAKFTF